MARKGSISTYNGSGSDVKYINIDAKAGDPNTFWVGKSGRYYRKKAEAKTDDPQKAVEPKDYYQKKSFFEQNKKAIVICGVLLVLAIVVLKYFDMGKLVLNGKKW